MAPHIQNAGYGPGLHYPKLTYYPKLSLLGFTVVYHIVSRTQCSKRTSSQLSVNTYDMPCIENWNFIISVVKTNVLTSGELASTTTIRGLKTAPEYISRLKN